MVGGGRRGAAEEVKLNTGNVFAALETLKKKKKGAGGDKAKGGSSSSSRWKQDAAQQQPPPQKEVFWAPAPLATKSWADVEDDDDDDDYFATTAPPRPVWGPGQGDDGGKEEDEEEDAVHAALQEVLKERIERVKAKKNDAFTSKSEFTEEMLEIRKAFVIIHGEMILLQNYSSLNYAALARASIALDSAPSYPRTLRRPIPAAWDPTGPPEPNKESGRTSVLGQRTPMRRTTTGTSGGSTARRSSPTPASWLHSYAIRSIPQIYMFSVHACMSLLFSLVQELACFTVVML